MACNRSKICICYLITSFLISGFIYTLISSNLENSRTLRRLREEVDEIAHVVLHTGPEGMGGDPKHLTEVVDALLKKRLAGIWDDLYTLKKQLRLSECASGRPLNSPSGSEVAQVPQTPPRVNYAAEELGAKIESVVADPVGPTNVVRNMLGLEYSSNPPVSMLRPSMEPGNCFGFKNNRSEVTIKLASEIFIEGVELEHICKQRAPSNDTSSAPKTVEISCMSATSTSQVQRLGTFVYKNSGESRAQLFAVKSTCKIRFVRLRFQDNHGHPQFTCVYRIAVYGRQE